MPAKRSVSPAQSPGVAKKMATTTGGIETRSQTQAMISLVGGLNQLDSGPSGSSEASFTAPISSQTAIPEQNTSSKASGSANPTPPAALGAAPAADPAPRGTGIPINIIPAGFTTPAGTGILNSTVNLSSLRSIPSAALGATQTSIYHEQFGGGIPNMGTEMAPISVPNNHSDVSMATPFSSVETTARSAANYQVQDSRSRPFTSTTPAAYASLGAPPSTVNFQGAMSGYQNMGGSTIASAPAPYVQHQQQAPAPYVQHQQQASTSYVQHQQQAPAPYGQHQQQAPAPYVQQQQQASAPYVQHQQQAPAPYVQHQQQQQQAPAPYVRSVNNAISHGQIQQHPAPSVASYPGLVTSSVSGHNNQSMLQHQQPVSLPNSAYVEHRVYQPQQNNTGFNGNAVNSGENLIHYQANNVPVSGISIGDSNSMYRPMDSICEPIGADLPASVISKIINSEFVDFAILLDKTSLDRECNGGRLFSVEKGNVVWLENRAKPAIEDIEEWTDAFLVFSSIYLSAHPSKATELLKYASIVRDAAARFYGWGWRIYDVQFRHRQQRAPNRSWAIVDGEMWLVQVGSQPRRPAKTHKTSNKYDGNNVNSRGNHGNGDNYVH